MKRQFILLVTGCTVWLMMTGTGLAQSNTFPSSGNVGIGTTSPQSKLHVYSGAARNQIRTYGYDSGASRYINIWHGSGSGVIDAIGGGKLYLNYDSGTDVSLVNGGGNVGIGTTSPEEKLDVTGNIALANNKAIAFRRADGNLNNRIEGLDREFRIRNTSSPGYITFHHNSGGGTAEMMRIHSNGYLGIGTTTPDELLTINGTAKAEEVIVVENVGADFVFEEDYALPELSEVEAHIQQYKRLPEIPSAEEMIEHGVKVGELQMKLLQKIEELTLYVIELEKRDRKKAEKIRQLEEKLKGLVDWD